jgi:hypothetical protein
MLGIYDFAWKGLIDTFFQIYLREGEWGKLSPHYRDERTILIFHNNIISNLSFLHYDAG